MHAHALPPLDQLQFLVGRIVETITLGPYTISLALSAPDVSITLEGRFEHIDAEGQAHVHSPGAKREVGPLFMRDLLEERVVEVSSTPFLLTIRFGNGAALVLGSDDGGYESGQIASDESGYIIF